MPYNTEDIDYSLQGNIDWLAVNTEHGLDDLHDMGTQELADLRYELDEDYADFMMNETTHRPAS